jgi:predicted nucleotidyltransferase
MTIFGSWAEATAREDRDTDEAVISDHFGNMKLLGRMETIGAAFARARILQPVQPLALTEAELEAEGKGSFLADEVKSRGQEVEPSG